MAFKLTKAEAKQRFDLVAELEIAGAAVATAIEAFNAAMTEAFKPVAEAVEAYNEKLEEAREFAEDIASSRRDEMANKSDRWQEGDRGQAAENWVSEWENISLDDLEFDQPDELEQPDPSHRDDLENLPDEMDV